MAKPKRVLNDLLHLLNKKPLAKGQIRRALKISRKTEYQNCKEAIEKGLIAEDSIGRFRLTLQGKLIINKADPEIDCAYFEVNSQVLPDSGTMEGRPTAKCTIYMEEAQKIMELDKDSREYLTALMMSGYGTMENASNIQASAGALLDAILDSKANDIGLFSILKSEYPYAVNVFNYETIPPGYDFMKRFMQLAGTKLKVFIEFDGEKWIKKHNFTKIEKEQQILSETSKKSLNNIRSLDDKRKIMFIVHELIDPDWEKEDKLESMNFFKTKNELKDYVHRLLRRFGIEKDKLEEILSSGFSSGFFQTEKMTLHHLTINRANESKFFQSLTFLHSDNLGSLKEEPISHMTGSKKEENPKEVNGRYADSKYFVSTASRQLDDFEKAFFDMLERTIDKFEKSKFVDGQLDTYPSLDGKEPIHLKAAKETLLQLLDTFYETINVCLLRSTILWPQRIKDKKILYTLNSIVFNKITDMCQVLYEALDSFHSGQFNSDFVNYAMASSYATLTFLKYHNTFKNSGLEKESEPLMDSVWSLYEEIKDWAFPEPSMYRWDFDHNRDGWKKFLEIQGKHPDQTSDNYYKNYMRQYGPASDTKR